MTRRELMSGAAAALAAPLPMDFGPCPRTLEAFLRYIVQRRTADGLNRSAGRLVYGGAPEDANIAWVAASAYRYPWSRFHRNAEVRQLAFALLDAIVEKRADGKWDDGGLNGYFGPHSLANAVLWWMETGDVDADRAARWRAAVANACDQGLVCLHYGPYRPSPMTGQYANPEMYLLSGLAAAWKLTGNARYRDEAANALRRYDEWLLPGGGMTYFFGSSPQHGYQHMVVKSIALYSDLTGDPLATAFLRRLAPYFPNVLHRSGLLTDAEQPHLKHTFFNVLNPAAPAMLACLLGDGANRWAADTAVLTMADNVDQRRPSFGSKGAAWHNYQFTTYTAAALRLLERHRLPAPAAPPARRVFMDTSFRGPRGQWDDFTAAVGTRQMNDSLAGAYMATSREPLLPLDAAVDGVYFEAIDGKTEFRTLEWSPTVTTVTADGFAAVGCLTRLCAPYWGEMPNLPGERGAVQVCDWYSLQHWAVWRDCLIGFGALRDHGTAQGRQMEGRIRWRLAPVGRTLRTIESGDRVLRFDYGALHAELECLEQAGGFAFRPASITEAPRAEWTPLLVRTAARPAGDFAHVATLVRPAASPSAVAWRALPNGAAAVMLEPGAKRALVWVVNLHRQMQQYMMDLAANVRVRTFKRNVELPRVPPGEPANAGLSGAESALWVIDADAPLDGARLLAAIRAGKSR